MSTAVPLPPLGNQFLGDEAFLNAYARLIPLESESVVLVRILGYMLLEAPSPDGRTYMANEINRCRSKEEILNLGYFHLSHFIRYFKFTSREPRTPSTHPSRPSFEDVRRQIAESLVPAPTSYAEAKRQALVRDNYRCVISGAVDLNSTRSPAIDSLSVDVAYPSLTDVSNIWTIACMFGGIPNEEVNGTGIHHLRNILTLETSVHTNFDNLEIWLELVLEFENRYEVKKRDHFVGRDLPRFVTLSSASSELPLPDPRYIAYHAACARVIKLSGAAEHISQVLRNVEETKVLSEDGTSGKLLDHLLSGVYQHRSGSKI
ncbi:hypothetical protein B0J17DRAFT_721147 [Rhizoctonia solani]|nr:hypothetical protein B0J17DRAFT_721147 [Rhizoctonia solani]